MLREEIMPSTKLALVVLDPSCWHDKCEFPVARVFIEQSKSSQLIYNFFPN